MSNLYELRLTSLFELNRRSLSNHAFKRALDSVRRAHSPDHPCRQLLEHVSNPESSAWSHRLPLLVLLAAQDRLLDRNQLREEVLTAWCSGAPYPEAILGRDTWIALFREAGFGRDGIPVDPPELPPAMYRGSWRQFCKGLSWTSNRHRAIKYAGDGYSDLYIAHPQPDDILAHITVRGDDEWIVDTTRLRVDYIAP